ncbi:MAG: indole-3-glycerol phosphate synthase TrpC [Verrucomicrobiia bacterium]|jgi:indole-3-glycerol phosphate synthase
MDILQLIVEQKKREVALLPEKVCSAAKLKTDVQQRGGARNFLHALKNPVRGTIALIAEVKKASPSAGIICKDFDPIKIAQRYQAAGATCISVLTDIKFFHGSPDYLCQIRHSVQLPLLRKDFIIDERQIYESIQLGADAILLIASILDLEKLKRFYDLIVGAGLAALVEVHNEFELDKALSIGANLIGINNRDLKTFKVDLSTTERLAKKIRSLASGDSIIIVAESGISNRADVIRLKEAGTNAILVGESLLKDSPIEDKIAQLII